MGPRELQRQSRSGADGSERGGADGARGEVHAAREERDAGGESGDQSARGQLQNLLQDNRYVVLEGRRTKCRGDLFIHEKDPIFSQKHARALSYMHRATNSLPAIACSFPFAMTFLDLCSYHLICCGIEQWPPRQHGVSSSRTSKSIATDACFPNNPIRNLNLEK